MRTSTFEMDPHQAMAQAGIVNQPFGSRTIRVDDVTVTVLEKARFQLSTGNGNVDVAGVQASGHVQSGNGSLMLEQARGDVTLSARKKVIAAVDLLEGTPTQEIRIDRCW